MAMIKIDNEKLKQAVDMLYDAVDYSGMHYAEVKTECYATTVIRGVGSSIEVPVEYLPILALKLLMEYEHVKNTIEIIAKRFREGVWE
jgi:nitrogen regulatory protein PII